MSVPPEAHSLWDTFWQSLAASTTLASAGWGAAGGMTSALSIPKLKKRDIVRQVVLGALVAGGLSVSAAAIMAAWLHLPNTVVPVIGAGGSASYLAGVFGPALFELILSRIRQGRAPTDSKE